MACCALLSQIPQPSPTGVVIMGTGVQTEHRGCFSQGQVNVLVWEGFLFYSQAAGTGAWWKPQAGPMGSARRSLGCLQEFPPSTGGMGSSDSQRLPHH